MSIKATIRTGYKARLGIVALAVLGFAAWFFYDGFVAYPKYQEAYATYEAYRQEDPQGYAQRWQAYARQHGLELQQPEPVSDTDIWVQKLLGVLCLLIGIPTAVFFAWSFFRWIEADEQGLHANGGRHAPWDAIQRIDETRWKAKGIADVHYEHEGRSGRIRLDDWKYEPQPTIEIYKRVKAHLGEEVAEPATAATPQQPA